jgi:tetratricopeptide (TPR) repeat protein
MPLDKEMEHLLLQEVESLIKRYPIDTCVIEFGKVIKENVPQHQVWDILELARTKIMGGKFDLGYIISIAVANSLPFDNKGVKPYYYAAISASKIGRFNKAKYYFKQTIELEPIYKINEFDSHGHLISRPCLTNKELSQVHHNFAVVLYELGDINDAKYHYQKAINLNAANAVSHNDYANILAKEGGREKEAEEHYLEAISLGLSISFFNYANLLAKLERTTDAERYYKNAIKFTPNDSQPHNNYAMLLEKLDRRNEAKEHYKKSIELNPNNWAAHNNYANLLRKNKNFSEAEKEIRIALSFEPNSPYILGTFGDILADEGYLKDAKRIFRNALMVASSMDDFPISEIHNSLGSVYGGLNEYGKAKREFIKAIGFNSKNVKAIRNLRKVNLFLIEFGNSRSLIEKIIKNIKSITIGPAGIGITFERGSINQLTPNQNTIIKLDR